MKADYEVLELRLQQTEQELAQERRSTAALTQDLSEARVEAVNAQAVSVAAHVYCEAWLDESVSFADARKLHDDLLDAHAATTPSAVESTHVLVERAELERVREIADAAATYVHCGGDDANESLWTALRVAVDGES